MSGRTVPLPTLFSSALLCATSIVFFRPSVGLPPAFPPAQCVAGISALLLPGPGRWRCIDRSLWLEEATEDELQELDDESQWTAVRNEGWAIHADGSLVKQIDPNHLEVQSARWLGAMQSP